jgi:hypothetical protein
MISILRENKGLKLVFVSFNATFNSSVYKPRLEGREGERIGGCCLFGGVILALACKEYENS